MSNSSTQNVKRSSSTMQKTRDEDNETKASDDLAEACDIMVQAATNYSRKHPAVVMMCTFLAGFYVGWKVKPW